jgi:predicted extracellular nuclease
MLSKLFLLFITLAVSLPSFATVVLSINTEFFWDSKLPHDGQIALGAVGNPPSEKYVQLEANAIALHIMYNDADIVGLTEIEGENVAKQILNYLPKEYKLVFKKGRDNFTGQDVAIITRYDVIGEPNNFKGIEGNYNGTKKVPSKALAVKLKKDSETYNVVVAHLISKRSNNDNKRAAQADAIVKYLNSKTGHNIVMGDLNDTPSSTTLNLLVKSGLNIINKNEYSYTYQNKKQLIDHILISDSLKSGATFKSFDLGAISDHRAVIAGLKQ